MEPEAEIPDDFFPRMTNEELRKYVDQAVYDARTLAWWSEKASETAYKLLAAAQAEIKRREDNDKG